MPRTQRLAQAVWPVTACVRRLWGGNFFIERLPAPVPLGRALVRSDICSKARRKSKCLRTRGVRFPSSIYCAAIDSGHDMQTCTSLDSADQEDAFSIHGIESRSRLHHGAVENSTHQPALRSAAEMKEICYVVEFFAPRSAEFFEVSASTDGLAIDPNSPPPSRYTRKINDKATSQRNKHV
jgi:hypothetical protein